MANLGTLIRQKTSALGSAPENNLDSGRIWTFHPTKTASQPRCNFCWESPGSGTVTVEIWGAAGSGGKMCCCGGGMPGNAPAYGKSTFNVGSSGYICGCVGYSCGNNNLCFRGCSTASCIQICKATSEDDCCFCMCAMGGRGGWAICNESGGSLFCCMLSNVGNCGTSCGTGCGTVCNISSGYSLGQSYGGTDLNCPERISCAFFGACSVDCRNCMVQYIATPPGIYSTDGGMIQVQSDCANGFMTMPGVWNAVHLGTAAMTRAPITGTPYAWCWNSGRYCGCYEFQGCGNLMPMGVPGPSAMPCSSVRDHTMRGGHGAVRIKWIAN